MTESILLVLNEQAALDALETIVPLFGDLIVVSCDGIFPKNKTLALQAYDALANDEDISVAVLNFDCLKHFKLKTKRYIVLDDILIEMHLSVAKNEISAPKAYQLIATVIESYFTQFAKEARINNFTFNYGSWKEYQMPRDRKCLLDLLGSRVWLDSNTWVAQKIDSHLSKIVVQYSEGAFTAAQDQEKHWNF